MILPQNAINFGEEIEVIQQPSYTYKIDFERKRVNGFCDGLEAVKQAVFLILNTERYEYLIYSTDYGSELTGLIGKDRFFVESELKRRIKEALIQDDRITNVDNFKFTYPDGDSLVVSFTVFSIYGDFEVERGLNT
jgi:hypothetical protein